MEGPPSPVARVGGTSNSSQHDWQREVDRSLLPTNPAWTMCPIAGSKDPTLLMYRFPNFCRCRICLICHVQLSIVNVLIAMVVITD